MTAAIRPVIVAGNWKMHTVPSEAGELARLIAARTTDPLVVRVICPPFVSLEPVRDALVGSDVAVGAQNVHHELSTGAYTGEIGTAMLVGLADWVIVGHSERRRDAGETDELIGRKLAPGARGRLRPILCVGEQLAERDAGRPRQSSRPSCGPPARAFARRPGRRWPTAGLVVAYEPVWAIGTGRTARGADAAAMADAIRRAVGRSAGLRARRGRLPVLYGGSVTAARSGSSWPSRRSTGCSSAGASLKVDEMAGIVARAG